MSSRKYKAAIIGCGKVAGLEHSPLAMDFIYSHAAGYCHNPAVELVAACDSQQDRLDQFARLWSIKGKYTDAEEMLSQEDIDIISIASPTAEHYNHLCITLEKNIPVILCEKPITGTLAQALVISRRLPGSASQVVVNYFRRFNPGLIELRKMLQNNLFGKIQRITVHYNKGILHNGGHFIDMIRWLFGDFATIAAMQVHDFDNLPDDQAVDVACKMESGVPVVLLAADHNNFNIMEIDILTDKGRLRLPNTGRQIQLFMAEQDAFFPHLKFLQEQELTVYNPWETIFAYIAEHLVAVLEKKACPLCTVEDGIYTLAVAEAIRQSLIRKETVFLADVFGTLREELAAEKVHGIA